MEESGPARPPVPLLNPANAVTAFRLLMTPFFVWAIVRGNMWAAIGTYLGSSFIDLFDGMIARRLHCESNFGANFDAAVDALFYTAAFVTMMAIGMLPVGLTSLLLGAAAANLAIRIWFALSEGRLVNYRSYASEYVGGGASGVVLTAITGFHPQVFLIAVVICSLPIPPFDAIQIVRLRRAQAAAAAAAARAGPLSARGPGAAEGDPGRSP